MPVISEAAATFAFCATFGASAVGLVAFSSLSAVAAVACSCAVACSWVSSVVSSVCANESLVVVVESVGFTNGSVTFCIV